MKPNQLQLNKQAIKCKYSADRDCSDILRNWVLRALPLCNLDRAECNDRQWMPRAWEVWAGTPGN